MLHAERRRKRFTKWRIDLAIHNALANAGKRACREPFQRLLAVVLSRSNMLRPQPLSGYSGWRHCNCILQGLLNLSQHYKNWLREAEDWNHHENGLRREFSSLARHLLAPHAVPEFMTKVWFDDSSPRAVKHQKLYKHLGLGNSIRGADLPIPLTKSTARYFPQAPDHLSVEQALRWSQVRGLGGDKQFAAAVVETRLGAVFECEDYWENVLRFLLQRPWVDAHLIPPFIDYMHLNQDGLSCQPFDRMTARSFEKLLGRVKNWMARNPLYGRPRLRWANTGIAGFRFIEPQDSQWSLRYWTIKELTNSQELVEEGNGLHHCVGRYAEACARRESSIWSLTCHGSLNSHRVLTIEVVPQSRKIVTALGKCNSRPKPDARKIMEKWAEQERLEIARWV